MSVHQCDGPPLPPGPEAEEFQYLPILSSGDKPILNNQWIGFFPGTTDQGWIRARDPLGFGELAKGVARGAPLDGFRFSPPA